MKHPFVTIVGNVATGKSTLASFLSSALNAHLIKADELYKTNPFFTEDMHTDHARWSLASDLWFLVKRVEIAKYIHQLLLKESVMQDSGLLMSFVYANSRLTQGHMNEAETLLYNTIADYLSLDAPKENLVIYLDLPPEQLIKRIERRGRDFEIKTYTLEYLHHIHLALKKLIDKLHTSEQPILTYDADNWCDIIKNPQDQKRIITDVREKLNL